MSALFDAPKRRRPSGEYPVIDPVALKGLREGTRARLRELATHALHALGVASPTPAFIENEMLRQFARLAPALPREGDRDVAMDSAIRRALEELDA
jgi:hypothetical protein